MIVVDGSDLRCPASTLERPRRFELHFADSNLVFFDLTWRGWGGPRAVAHGKARACSRTGGCRTHPTLLTARSRQRCGQEDFYDRLTAGFVPWPFFGPVDLPVETIPCAHPAGKAS